MNEIPILVLVYDRLDHLKNLINSLYECELCELVILNVYSDAAKNSSAENKIRAIRNYVRNLKGFNKINLIERHNNIGGLENGALALKDMEQCFDYFITLEDDVTVHRNFLKVMHKLAKKFYYDQSIVSISLYNPARYGVDNTFYLSKHYSSWGALLWSHKRLLNDLRIVTQPYSEMRVKKMTKTVRKIHPKLPRYLKRIDAGEKLTDYHATYLNIRNNTYQLRSYYSFVINHGYDGSGERCDIDLRMQNQEFHKMCDAEPQVSLMEYNPKNDRKLYQFFHPMLTLNKVFKHIFKQRRFW